jgi:hypothetical protein
MITARRKLFCAPAALASLVAFLIGGMTSVRADDARTIGAINKAAAQLDDAFVHGNPKEIRGAMTSDHLAVTPYYDGPQSADAQIASLGDLHYSQKTLDGPHLTLLGPDAALRTFTAEFVGTFKGKEIPRRQFVTSVMVKRNGRWLERFYQTTTLGP